MAGVSILPAEVLLSKRVQEMVLNFEEPQPPYICRDDCTDTDVFVPPSQPPIIDFSILSPLESSTAQEELQKLRSALCSWGCFQVFWFEPFTCVTCQRSSHFFSFVFSFSLRILMNFRDSGNRSWNSKIISR